MNKLALARLQTGLAYGVLGFLLVLVLFPFYVRPGESPEMKRLPRWKQMRHAAYYELEWRRRLATYTHRFAISEFSREWTRRRWGVDCQVVYPPVDVEFATRPKEPVILSVGPTGPGGVCSEAMHGAQSRAFGTPSPSQSGAMNS